jgi:hypothetical protein
LHSDFVWKNSVLDMFAQASESFWVRHCAHISYMSLSSCFTSSFSVASGNQSLKMW